MILRKSNTILRETSQYNYRALLKAAANLSLPMMQVESAAVHDYRIERIFFYGSRFTRANPNCSGDQRVNLWLRGSGWTVNDIESSAAPCNTSTVVDDTNSDFTISNSWFANNGWSEDDFSDGQCPSPVTRCWADGLTVHACVNGWIHDNEFRDNTDIDLVVGGGPNCTVESNNIVHTLSYGFAGIHVGWFPSGDPNIGNGNHEGNVYRWNSVVSGFNKLGFGILVGFHPWATDFNLTAAGRVVDNHTISGAVINLAVEAAFTAISGEVSGNNPTSPQGDNAYKRCTISANYTAYQPHTLGVTKQPGWTELQFDNEACTLHETP